MDIYLDAKALHIVSLVMWFAGLFYLPRILVYYSEAGEKPENEKKVLRDQLTIMAKRLYYIITNTGMILTLIFGLLLIHDRSGVLAEGWFHIKLTFLALLFGFHHACGRMVKKAERGEELMSSGKLRMFNEIPTALLFAIVFLAVFKEGLSLVWAAIALVVLIILLTFGVKLYKKARES